MFEDSLLESSGRLNTKLACATIFPFALQFLLIGIAVLTPLIYTDVLPKQQLITLLVVPRSSLAPPSPPAVTPSKVIKLVRTEIVSGQLRIPTKIPAKIAIVKEEAAPPLIAAVGGVPWAAPGGQIGGVTGVIGGILNSAMPSVPKAATSQRIRISEGIQEANLISQVKVVYPLIARKAHVRGVVVLRAEISEKGILENLYVISGHPLLVPNAIEAVKRWRYKPYYLNGEPVAVETTITVNFTGG